MCMLSLTHMGRIYQMTEQRCTIPGFDRLTKQQMFNMAAKHLLSTRAKSFYNGSCTYSGLGCAASVFLKEETREKLDFEGSWSDLVHAKFASKHNETFVNVLQVAHDGAAWLDDGFLEDWKERMKTVAQNYNLDASILEESHD